MLRNRRLRIGCQQPILLGHLVGRKELNRECSLAGSPVDRERRGFNRRRHLPNLAVGIRVRISGVLRPKRNTAQGSYSSCQDQGDVSDTNHSETRLPSWPLPQGLATNKEG